jgi:hypothetical protein
MGHRSRDEAHADGEPRGGGGQAAPEPVARVGILP